MRIPASVVVMSLVTATPFALAMRDEVKQRRAEREAKEAAKRAEEEEQRREAEEEKARQEAERKAAEETTRMHAAVDALFGDQPGTLGPALAPVFEGKDAAASPYYKVTPIERLGKRTGADIEFKLDDYCASLPGWITSRWGEGDESYRLDTTAHRRVRWEPGNCLVRVETYATPEEWIAPTMDAIVPLAVVGKPAAQVRANLGNLEVRDLDTDEGEGFSWNDESLGLYNSYLVAYTANGKVVGLTAATPATAEIRNALVERLTKLFGAPVVDDNGLVTWPKKKITLNDDESQIRLSVGNVP